jgi:hypothetical protein
MSRTRLLPVLFLLAVLTACIAYGQIRSATITGTVTDATGAVVPRAQVIVTEQETAVSSRTLTTESGSFTVPYLPAGTYTTTINAPGFAEYKVSGIVVTTGQTVRSDAQLKLAAVGASVEVQALAATIQTDSSTVQGLSFRAGNRHITQSYFQPLVLRLPSGRRGAARTSGGHDGHQLVWNRHVGKEAVRGGWRQRRPHLDQRHSVGRTSHYERRL